MGDGFEQLGAPAAIAAPRAAGLLYERKLNANYYNPRDGQIWHVPGFSGLGHRCPSPPAADALPLHRKDAS